MVEHLKNSALPRAFADVVGDLADLVQKEIHLAKAELSEKLSAKLRAGVWIGVAAGLGLIAALLVIEGIVFGIATFGIALHWSCLIVAAVLAAAAQRPTPRAVPMPAKSSHRPAPSARSNGISRQPRSS